MVSGNKIHFVSDSIWTRPFFNFSRKTKQQNDPARKSQTKTSTIWCLQIRVRNGKTFFLFLNQNICCGYSKEPSQWDGSLEHPKQLFKLMGKTLTKKYVIFLCGSTKSICKRMMEYQHIGPDEEVLIHDDLQAKCSLGVHWGTFRLTNEFYHSLEINHLKKIVPHGNWKHESFAACSMCSPCADAQAALRICCPLETDMSSCK